MEAVGAMYDVIKTGERTLWFTVFLVPNIRR
jgi:hypothetical protein